MKTHTKIGLIVCLLCPMLSACGSGPAPTLVLTLALPTLRAEPRAEGSRRSLRRTLHLTVHEAVRLSHLHRGLD